MVRFYALLASLAVSVQAGSYDASRHLWYNTPGNGFESALAIGNGRLGALVHGSASETIHMNENSIWSGYFTDRVNPNALDALPRVRAHLEAGNITLAGREYLANMSGNPTTSRMYSVTNDVVVDFGHAASQWTNYERWLDTAQGHAGVTYLYNGVNYTREYVASYHHGVIAGRFKASEAGSLGLTLGMTRAVGGILANTATASNQSISLLVGGRTARSIDFASGLRLVHDGDLTATSGGNLTVEGATTVDFFYDAETSFQWTSQEAYVAGVASKLQAASAIGFDGLRSRALRDHASLMSRVSLSLGSSGDTGLVATNTRISNYAKNPDGDPEFITLAFQFARHLLVSSSRNAGGKGLGVPANLQGLWNVDATPPWGSKFTVNINLEMNYWLAETTNLADTLRPLWDLTDRSRKRGKDVADRMFGCPGWVAHHNLDLWGDSAPHDNGTAWTPWPLSNLWLASHYMEHYRFTGDGKFLRDRAWGVFYDAAQFWSCYLFRSKEGYYVSGPSSSPENFLNVSSGLNSVGLSESIDISPQMDNSLLHDFFTNLQEVAGILDIDISTDPNLKGAPTFVKGLRPTAMGKHGQIQEWSRDYEEIEPGHRHISHLWDLFPGHRMTPLINETLSEAARVSLNRRVQGGSGSTGWSRAWIAACYARLFDGDTTLTHIQHLLSNYPMPNMFHGASGKSRFQIDSNFGLVAAVAESLVQSHAGVVHLLPSLPSKIAEGRVTGIVARGGFVVDVAWSEGRLTEAKIASKLGNRLNVRVADDVSFKLNGASETTVNTARGETYTIELA